MSGAAVLNPVWLMTKAALRRHAVICVPVETCTHCVGARAVVNFGSISAAAETPLKKIWDDHMNTWCLRVHSVFNSAKINFMFPIWTRREVHVSLQSFLFLTLYLETLFLVFWVLDYYTLANVTCSQTYARAAYTSCYDISHHCSQPTEVICVWDHGEVFLKHWWLNILAVW